MATIPVKYYHAAMQGAPQVTVNNGDLTQMLDAVLVNGFNPKTISDLRANAGVATLTIAGGHGFTVGQAIWITGVDQSEYGGEFVVTGTTSNTLTFNVTGTPPVATGASMVVKVAPLGWECPYTGTNKRAYRSKNPASNKPFLRVDNSLDPVYNASYAKKGKVTMAEGMSDIDTFVGARAPFDPTNPTKNEVGYGSGASAYDGYYKWYYAKDGRFNWSDASGCPDASYNRQWVIVGDDRGFYLLIDFGLQGYTGRSQYCFTDFVSFRAGDAYNTILSAVEFAGQASQAASNSPTFSGNMVYSGDYTGKILMRDHTQVGLTQRACFMSLNTNNGQTITGYSTSIPWPNPADYALVLHPIYLLQENAKGLRGKMPGWFWVCNSPNVMSDLATVTNVIGYPGKTFLMVAAGVSDQGNAARMAFDITGPWW